MSCSGLVTVLALLGTPHAAAGETTAGLLSSATGTPSPSALRPQQERNSQQDMIVDMTNSAARSLLVRTSPIPCEHMGPTVL